MTEAKSANPTEEDFAEVTMVTPWVAREKSGQTAKLTRGNVSLQSARQLKRRYGENFDMNTCKAILPRDGLAGFVKERSEVHKEYIRQEQATKRWGIVSACACVLASAAILVFAPEGRETISYIVGTTLIVVAAGAFGFSSASISNGDIKAEVRKD